MADNKPILTDAMIAEIEKYFWLSHTAGGDTPVLHVVDRDLRHVPLQAVVEVAELLGLAPSEVQDTLSFYGFFKQAAAHGETRAWVCRSLSCALRGSDEVIEHMCRRLGIAAGQTTPDGRITLESAECSGACEHAPCMLAGETLHRDLNPDKADSFLDAIGCEG